ncbi:MAG: hypothetical protein DWQ10_13900 [Calditrichaeota bacterium]|nr:MAG: hypothetical protein DWQ10_13900 [Calditrichota bacterium]
MAQLPMVQPALQQIVLMFRTHSLYFDSFMMKKVVLKYVKSIFCVSENLLSIHIQSNLKLRMGNSLFNFPLEKLNENSNPIHLNYFDFPHFPNRRFFV